MQNSELSCVASRDLLCLKLVSQIVETIEACVNVRHLAYIFACLLRHTTYLLVFVRVPGTCGISEHHIWHPTERTHSLKFLTSLGQIFQDLYAYTYADFLYR